MLFRSNPDDADRAAPRADRRFPRPSRASASTTSALASSRTIPDKSSGGKEPGWRFVENPLIRNTVFNTDDSTQRRLAPDHFVERGLERPLIDPPEQAMAGWGWLFTRQPRGASVQGTTNAPASTTGGARRCSSRCLTRPRSSAGRSRCHRSIGTSLERKALRTPPAAVPSP